MKFYVFAFSTAETRLCRTLVRRRVVFRRFCIFFISPQAGSAKKAQTEKADKSMIWTFIRHKYRKSWWNPIGFLRKNDYPLFLPPKTVSAVRQYGDEAFFDDSASFLSLPFAGRLKSSGPKKRKQIILIRHLYVPYCEKGVGILTDSCIWIDVFAFSASDFAARRTIVRLAARNRVLQTILSIFFREAKKAPTEKADKSVI